MYIERSIDIKAGKEAIFRVISDFHHWKSWSPWLICEPEVKVDVQPDGKYYKWEGRRTGSGEMWVVDEKADAIAYDLAFIKPFKSHATVQFICSDNGHGSTRVTWNNSSRLPFFMFWMRKSMEAFIASDYDRGLKMLKEYIEQGKVNSQLNFVGENGFPGCTYLGVRRETSFEEMSSNMQTDFGTLDKWLQDEQLKSIGAWFSIYHKWDMVRGKVSYTAGVPLESVPIAAPDGLITGDIPQTRVYTLQHVGDYTHLGNAWSALYMMQRAKEFRPVKRLHPFEIYRNMPGEVPTEELVTDIHFPIN